MANDSKKAFNGKVTLGANNILGMGTFEFGGGTFALLDDTEFGDEHEQVLAGLITGGTVKFSGKYKVDDTQGQDLIREAFWYQSQLTDLRFWVDSASYYTPNSTTAAGGGLPANVPVSHILINEEPTVSADNKGVLMDVSFSGKIVVALRLI